MHNQEPLNSTSRPCRVSISEPCNIKILLLVDHSIHHKSEFYLSGIHFKGVDYQNAVKYLGNMHFDAVMMLYHNDSPIEKMVQETRHMTQRIGIPVLLYSPKQTDQAKDVALKYHFHDYYYGSINKDIKRKLEIILKSNKYRKTISREQVDEKKPTSETWKRVFDVMVASCVLLMLLPLLIVVAVIVKLESKGPVFYVSKRAGKNYHVFNFIKFRSMYQDADSRLSKVSNQNQYGEGIFIKIKNDPRVTPFGRFLRKSSIDEIPQLINVLKGDMSIVGNRPLPLYEAKQLTKDQAARRFLAPAGVTGLWQVTKRGKDDMSDEERIDLDVEYAHKSSLWYDLRLIFNTIPAMIQKEAV